MGTCGLPDIYTLALKPAALVLRLCYISNKPFTPMLELLHDPTQHV